MKLLTIGNLMIEHPQPNDTENHFFSLRIRPRVLIDVSHRDTSCNIFEIKLDFPVAIAPVSMQKMASPEGELASARGNFSCIFIWNLLLFE